ncbi:MAG TPA: inositol monophosphatase family protein [Bacillales bacterium]|nr:inositol monophosphatase family protein [Bacillales bacterium]
MTVTDWKQVDRDAKAWMKEAAERIRKSFKKRIRIGYKANPDDLVTEMDRETEKYFADQIHEHYPDHRILGEEGFGDEISTTDGTIWIIDPIDGTMNFVHQQSHFAISIGIFHDGVGQIGLIYDVVADEWFHCIKGHGAFLNDRPLKKRNAVPVEQSIIGLNATWLTNNRRIDPRYLAPLVGRSRGTRSYGSAAIELAYVAAGRLDAYFSMRLSPWDFAAGLVLLDEVGGVVTTVDGKPVRLLEQNSIFAAEKQLHQEIFETYIRKGIDKDLFMKL